MTKEEALFGAAAIISRIIASNDLDDNKLKELLLDDGGQCIHATISGGMALEEIAKIGHEFGDDCPIIYPRGKAIQIVIANEKHDEFWFDEPDAYCVFDYST